MTFDRSWLGRCETAKDMLRIYLDQYANASSDKSGWIRGRAADWAAIYMATKEIADNETKKKFYDGEIRRAESMEPDPAPFDDGHVQKIMPNMPGKVPERPRLGSFVTGILLSQSTPRQGVLVWIGKERAVIIGLSGTAYVVDATRIIEVKDIELLDDPQGLSFVTALREEIRYSFGDEE